MKVARKSKKETMRLIANTLPQSKNKVNSNSNSVRPGSKVKYNEGKYKLTRNYID